MLEIFLIAIGICLGMLLFMEIGRMIGRYRPPDPGGASGRGVIEAAIFALMGLLLAFTFSGSATRMDERRRLIVEEANTTGTAYQLLDLLAPAAQPALREQFRRYLDLRIQAYSELPDIAAAEKTLARSVAMQGEMWAAALAGARASDQPNAALVLLMPALNQTFDIATTRFMATRMHPPRAIWVMQAILLFVCALLAGHGMAGGVRRSWVHVVTFAVFSALTFFLILDLEYPRMGWINVKDFDQLLVKLRQSMK